jgi:hypothetical protein
MYSDVPGIKDEILEKLVNSSKEINFFDLFFDDKFWNNLVVETNRYAEQKENFKSSLSSKKDIWTPTNIEEMKVYFALCIIMTQIKKSTINSNWSKRQIIETPIFGKCMSRFRFLSITKNLHFFQQ